MHEQPEKNRGENENRRLRRDAQPAFLPEKQKGIRKICECVRPRVMASASPRKSEKVPSVTMSGGSAAR